VSHDRPHDPPPGPDHPFTKHSRPTSFDAERYQERNTVERCLNKLRQHRAVAARYDKRDRIYQGAIDVASIRMWLRDPVT
jgi:transposase